MSDSNRSSGWKWWTGVPKTREGDYLPPSYTRSGLPYAIRKERLNLDPGDEVEYHPDGNGNICATLASGLMYCIPLAVAYGIKAYLGQGGRRTRRNKHKKNRSRRSRGS